MHTCWMLRNRMFLSELHTCLMLRNRMFLSDLHTCLMLRSTGVGWGGVGMLTFLAHAHMLDATQQDVSLGVAHMIDATQQDVSLGLAHMFDATEHWGGVGWGC